MRRLEAGESFIITRHGTPVGELHPIRRRRFVDTDALLEAFRRHTRIDRDRFRADLDAIVDQDPTPRG